MSTTVEASSRSSAHCNVFDALHAVDTCTPPAASQLYLHRPDGDGDGDTDLVLGRNGASASVGGGGGGSRGGLGSPWEGLASFLFGDDWCERERHPARSTANDDDGADGGGDRVGGATTVANGGAAVGEDGASSCTAAVTGAGSGGGGWNVPHYDSIEPFPQRSFRTGRRRVFFHELGKEEEACRGNMMGAGNGEGGGGGGGKLGAA